MKSVYFVSLGCDKNLVDSEVMIGSLQIRDYQVVQEPESAHIIVVNTCAFIHDAKEESIETILEMATYKDTAQCEALIVAGCLSERYRDELMKEIPEVDGVIGASNYDDLPEVVAQIINQKMPVQLFRDVNHEPVITTKRTITSTTAYAYLKIAEGCNNRCTYCIIPSLRGAYRSRSMEDLVEEATYLVSQGKKELILVAQDVAKYGMDRYNRRAIVELLNQLESILDLKWIRLLYCYPEDVTDDLIVCMQHSKKILPYIDMPMQHADDTILKRMARMSQQASVVDTVRKLRSAMPDICIRTTFIVGFPGETNAQYETLKTFIEEMKLDRVGVFTYSLEEGTKAATMPDQVNGEVMVARRDALMAIQQGISKTIHEGFIGKTLMVMIEGYLPDEAIYVGRSYRDAPDVDGSVFVTSSRQLMLGDRVPVTITDANAYDLIGVLEDESCQ